MEKTIRADVNKTGAATTDIVGIYKEIESLIDKTVDELAPLHLGLVDRCHTGSSTCGVATRFSWPVATVCRVKLSEYASLHDIQYRAAWNRFRADKIPGAYQDELGRIRVPDAEVEADGQPGPERAAVYARVSTHKQKDDLVRQAERMVAFANARGLQATSVVKEIASGVNDTRPRLTKLLGDDTWDVLVVEHKDRLSRVGFAWFCVLLGPQNRRVLVADAATEQTNDLMDDFVSSIYSFAARLYGLRSARRRTDQVLSALEVVSA